MSSACVRLSGTILEEKPLFDVLDPALPFVIWPELKCLLPNHIPLQKIIIEKNEIRPDSVTSV